MLAYTPSTMEQAVDTDFVTMVLCSVESHIRASWIQGKCGKKPETPLPGCIVCVT